MITLHRKILCQLHIAYFELFRRFISLLRKAQFLGYYASMILLLRISNYLWTANWLILSRLEIVYIIDHCAQKTLMTTSNRLFGNISNIYKATAQSTIFWLLRIIQLFSYCTSPNYLSTANRQKYFTNGNHLNIWLLCIEKLYKNFKSPIWKHIDDSYRYCAKPNF